jgi:heptaprenyl diphosphate synthase
MDTHDNRHLGAEAVLKASLLCAAVALNALEFFVPRVPFFLWLKPGLANVVTMLWIIRFGGVDALLFTALRIWTVGFYFGFSFLTLSLSFSGGVCATAVMAVFWRLLGRRRLIGTVGLGVIGALSHNTGQVLMVWALMARNVNFFYQVPVMIAASVLFGAFVGALVPFFMRIADEYEIPRGSRPRMAAAGAHPPKSHALFSACILALCVSLVFIRPCAVLAAVAAAVTAAVQVLLKGSWRAFVYPVKNFWPLFVFVAALYLFFSFGKRIEAVPLVTYEGAAATAAQWLRLWTWLELSFVFTCFRFHTVVFAALKRLFPSHRDTLYAGLLALEYFPFLISAVRRPSPSGLVRALRHPLETSQRAVRKAFRDVSDAMAGEKDPPNSGTGA